INARNGNERKGQDEDCHDEKDGFSCSLHAQVLQCDLLSVKACSFADVTQTIIVFLPMKVNHFKLNPP
ncbi:MAG TPA: hypothetical protein DEP60_06265, partial [Ruminococcaceae bacterium]|nr:hypothetical protein [Oscillospiraceae bacterium]